MAVKQKRMKRTIRKGLRSLSATKITPPPNLSPRTIDKMRGILFDEVLANGKTKLDIKQLFVVDHALLVVQFHRGEKPLADVYNNEEKGQRVKFDQDDISALNFLILEAKERGQLESVFKQLQTKSKK